MKISLFCSWAIAALLVLAPFCARAEYICRQTGRPVGGGSASASSGQAAKPAMTFPAGYDPKEASMESNRNLPGYGGKPSGTRKIVEKEDAVEEVVTGNDFIGSAR
jgi:hypothetical protein